MDVVYINDLKIDTFIGIYDWEQRVRQTVCINLQLGWDIAGVAGAGDIALALDYKAVSDRLIALVEDQHFGLLETLAEQIAERVMAEFQVPWLRLRLAKPGAVPAAGEVGVIIERGVRGPQGADGRAADRQQ